MRFASQNSGYNKASQTIVQIPANESYTSIKLETTVHGPLALACPYSLSMIINTCIYYITLKYVRVYMLYFLFCNSVLLHLHVSIYVSVAARWYKVLVMISVIITIAVFIFWLILIGYFATNGKNNIRKTVNACACVFMSMYMHMFTDLHMYMYTP